MGCVLPYHRKGWRAGHAHPHCQTRALASSSRADAEPRLQPQSPCGAASGRGVSPQSGSCHLSQHRDHHDDSDQASDPVQRHPLVPDDSGEQDEDGSVMQLQAQEGRANILRLSEDESNNDREMAHTELAMQPSASKERVNLQQNIGHRRRRRRCDTYGEEDCSPIVGSDAKQGKDEDVVRPPRGKRRKVNTSAPITRRTAPKRQICLRLTDFPSLQAQTPPTQGLKRRQSQRSISKPRSSGGSASEEKTVEAAFASFEEWPLEAVLKHVWVDGVATFQVEFSWNPCTNHGRNDRVPEGPRRKSLAERTSSIGRALPSGVVSIAEEIRGDEYFQVEEILDSRRRGRRMEYLVKWEGYRHEHDSWEPAAHSEKCPEMLRQFRQRAGLSMAPSM
ncbi:hypothetical protein QBC36DRAFT_313398 [Triangularia setosa]|uniref:Chromo domain-containing protein n=1 Tax=Triangularia setosa TaxID=2587417 RepID=A0AAN6W486_9PEZI|nr:hypothetical protein QBC36DRAFT_313398 [Podospora setosa]